MDQCTWLMQAGPGQSLLNHLHIEHTCTPKKGECVPDLWHHMLEVSPLPCNMEWTQTPTKAYDKRGLEHLRDNPMSTVQMLQGHCPRV